MGAAVFIYSFIMQTLLGFETGAVNNVHLNMIFKCAVQQVSQNGFIICDCHGFLRKMCYFYADQPTCIMYCAI